MLDARKKQLRRRLAEKLGQQYAANSPLPRELTTFLNFLPDLTTTEILHGLLSLRGIFTALQEKDPGACTLFVGMLVRPLKLSRRDVEAALGLHPQYDLDTQLLAAVRGLEHEVRHGLLFLSHVVARVNANRSEHEALTSPFIARRLRELRFDFGRHRPSRMRWDRTRLFPEATAPMPLLPLSDES